MITIHVETDEEQRLVESTTLFGGVSDPLAVSLRVVRDGQVVEVGARHAGVGGSGGTDADAARVRLHAGQPKRHVVTLDGKFGPELSHPGKCDPDCPVSDAFQRLTPAMRATGGTWTCDVQDGALMLLERIGE